MSLKYILLSELASEEKTGYDIVKSFDNNVGYFWNASHQQVYRELNKLDSLKLIRQKVQRQIGKPDKKLYISTAKGLKELEQWIKQPLADPPVRNSLLVKILAASAVEENEIISVLKHSQKNTTDILTLYKEIELKHYSPAPDKDNSLESKALYIALRKGILKAESHLLWIDEALSTFSA